MIDLNNEEFDAKESKIFNNGVAGRTRCIFDSIQPKTNEDKPNSPDFKVIFKDQSGASVNLPFWAITDVNDENYTKNLQRDGKKLKNLVHGIMGPATSIPAAETAVELLSGVMNLIRSKAGQAVWLMTTYGTDTRPSQYLNVRGFSPFIEPINTEESESKLKFTNFEMQTKVEGTSGSDASTSAVNEEVDWAE